MSKSSGKRNAPDDDAIIEGVMQFIKPTLVSNDQIVFERALKRARIINISNFLNPKAFNNLDKNNLPFCAPEFLDPDAIFVRNFLEELSSSDPNAPGNFDLTSGVLFTNRSLGVALGRKGSDQRIPVISLFFPFTEVPIPQSVHPDKFGDFLKDRYRRWTVGPDQYVYLDTPTMMVFHQATFRSLIVRPGLDTLNDIWYIVLGFSSEKPPDYGPAVRLAANWITCWQDEKSSEFKNLRAVRDHALQALRTTGDEFADELANCVISDTRDPPSPPSPRIQELIEENQPEDLASMA